MKKRGISIIVATVLIILITVAAISIIWLTIIPMINENIDTVNIEDTATVVSSGGYTVYNKDTGILHVQVKQRGILSKIEIAISSEGNSEIFNVTGVPGNNQMKTYILNLGNKFPNLDNTVFITIVPYVSKGKDDKATMPSPEATVKSVPIILAECRIATDCNDYDSCTIDNCNAESCTYSIAAPICNPPSTITCGIPISSSNGCGICSPGLSCTGSDTCNGAICIPDDGPLDVAASISTISNADLSSDPTWYGAKGGSKEIIMKLFNDYGSDIYLKNFDLEWTGPTGLNNIQTSRQSGTDNWNQYQIYNGAGANSPISDNFAVSDNKYLRIYDGDYYVIDDIRFTGGNIAEGTFNFTIFFENSSGVDIGSSTLIFTI